MKSRTTKKCPNSMLQGEETLDEDEGMIYSDDELYQDYGQNERVNMLEKDEKMVNDDELYQDFGQEKAPKKKKVKLNICKSGASITSFLSDGDFVDDDSELPQEVVFRMPPIMN
ncbi:unnamed protein product [Caenorhabditis brenneri]